MTLIKSISGIRGIINTSINSNIISQYVEAFSKISPKGIILLARDTRSSGKDFISISTSILNKITRDTINCGIIPTPTAQYIIKKNNFAGGIVFTASHNPSNWNGMKFIDSRGIFLDKEKFNQLDIESKKIKIKKISGDSCGKDYSKESINSHINNILNLKINSLDLIKNKKFKIVVDCVNGATSKALPKLLKKLNCDVIGIYCKYSEVFERSPEPIPRNLNELSKYVIKNKADLGLATDPDGDRLSVVDNKGNPLGEELTLSMCVYYLLKYFPNKRKYPIVTNLSTSLLSEKISRKYNTPFIRTPVGEINVVKQMEVSKSILGGEGNGGVILKESHLGRDSLVGTIMILNLLANENKTSNQIYNSFPKYYIQKSSLELNNYDSNILSRIKEEFKNEKIVDVDGLKIIWDDEWVHIRKSNTEPILRIISESKSIERSNELISLIKEIIT